MSFSRPSRVARLNETISRHFRAALIPLLLTPFACSRPAHRPVESERIVFRVPADVEKKPQKPLDGLLPGVSNFGVVSPDLYRGAVPSRDGLKSLADIGVKTVIDLRSEEEESADIPPGIKYIRLPVSPWHADTVDVRHVLDVIATSPKPVFIHCYQGRDRTGLAVAAYRLSKGMSTADAIEELRNFHVNPWWKSPIENRIFQLRNSGSLDATPAAAPLPAAH